MKLITPLKCLLVFAAFFTVSVLPAQTTINLVADAATFVNANETDTNYGSSIYMEIRGGTEVSNTCRDLLYWDLSSIPDEATITSVTLTMTKYNQQPSSNASSMTIYLNLTTSSWSEDTVTWSTQPTYDDSTDYGSFTVNESGLDANGTQYNVSTAELVDLVQGWVDGTISNNGLDLISSNAATWGRVRLNSDDATSGQPTLSVTYVIPEASSISLIGGVLALLCTLFFSRKRR